MMVIFYKNLLGVRWWQKQFLALLCLLLMGGVMVEARAKLRVITSFTIIADMARNVAGDVAEVASITKPGADIHDYQPTPRDLVKASKADLILWNGLNLERWYKRFLSDVRDLPSAVVSEGVEPISIYSGAYSGKPNPHAWMSITNGLIYVQNIERALIKYDPENTLVYENNSKRYQEQLMLLRKELAESFANLPAQRRYLATSEGAFSYLAKDFDLKEVFLWSINADQQGTPQQVRRMIDLVREHRIPVIFSESTISDKPAKQIVAETEAVYGGVLYVDSLSKPDGEVPTYLSLLRTTISTILEGFSLAGVKAE